MRKIVLIIGVFWLAILNANSQGIMVGLNQPAALAANAGKDTLVCTGHPVTLGGVPTATGGDHSYFYMWSPPDGLNDPTSSNPISTVTVSTTYMLKVTDGKGCTAVSFISVRVDPCLGIDEEKLGGKLTVFPNPSSGVFKISGLENLSSELIGIEILNRLGQVVYRREYQERYSGDLEVESNISDGGIYFLRIRLSDRIISERLILR
jgi:hypothetical protein